jgi:hypothetical protein
LEVVSALDSIRQRTQLSQDSRGFTQIKYDHVSAYSRTVGMKTKGINAEDGRKAALTTENTKVTRIQNVKCKL